MFFYLSKLFWFVTQPSTILLLLLILGAILLLGRARRTGAVLVILSATGLAMAAVSPLSSALYLPLEDRFPRVEPQRSVTGIIVLGGVFDVGTGTARNSIEVNESAERITETLMLAHRFPRARIVFTGGSTRLFAKGPTEAAAARRFFTEAGFDPDRLMFENQSRNTYENAIYTKETVHPRKGETWLLVTSAYHMPRAVGSFRKAGWQVYPWPVDYRTGGRSDLVRPMLDPARGLQRTDRAVREWLGLAVYWLSKRSSALFPAPEALTQ